MYAAVQQSAGAPPRYLEFAEPVAAEGENLIEVRAAALHRIDRARASGKHYASPRELPAVCGTDGVGVTQDGERVWFALPRAPFGAMAERTVVPRWMCAPLPDEVGDAEAAALINPGMGAYLPLAWRGRLVDGETVLVLGATGVTGRLAVRLARLLGAGRVVAAGRDPRGLESLDADAVIRLDRPREELVEAFTAAAGDTGYQVVVDYVWGEPVEALLAALTTRSFQAATTETRLVQVGDGAGPEITLSAGTLRSAAITLLGSGGFAPPDIRREAYGKLVGLAASGTLRVATDQHPLADVETLWTRGDQDGKRIVLRPVA
ncbi:quinone oxidoreductase family protein [Actinokineospora cianjurensis]|uniref:NADPH2:quinone reductase n=1 Tax=Actinokineospora cianjurensis TaxID=585224 RepID=A0A421B3D2_9PSEU|nr:zinc-binding alcohol dehydrogenase family protein [Actinokineospora cianjurensis]RLK58877.1 NADPH2:quinone reductase [Actinokineospora cianjurensis]